MTPSIHRIHVAVGVIKNNRHEILIAKRPAHLHQGGLWEFPGGKVEKNETAREALCRELNEELGITVEIAHPLIGVVHDYPDKSVLLDVWLVEKFTGQPRGNEAQPLQWVSVSDLKSYQFPQANREIINTLEAGHTGLPDEIMITGAYDDLDDYVFRLKRALDRKVRWVHLRAHTCSYDEYRRLHELTDNLCKHYGARLTANTSIDRFYQLCANSLHFTAERLLNSVGRPVSKTILFGVSCHNLAEVQHAESIDADYLLLGSVFATPTHPGNEPIGLEKFSDWAKQTSKPVFALGGVDPEIKEIIKSVGGYGVAGISRYWQ